MTKDGFDSISLNKLGLPGIGAIKDAGRLLFDVGIGLDSPGPENGPVIRVTCTIPFDRNRTWAQSEELVAQLVVDALQKASRLGPEDLVAGFASARGATRA